MDTVTEALDGRHEIGGNNPPTALEAAAELTATATNWLAERPEITDADMAKEAGELVERLRTSKKNLAAAQKADLAPHDQAIAEVKAQYREPASQIETALGGLLARSGDWLKKENDRIAAERAAREAEARRLREEADRLERERLEAARRDEEEKRRRIEAETQTAADEERSELQRQEVIATAERAAEAAKTAKLAERAAVKKKPEVAAIKAAPTQRAVTLRVYWSAVVTDETAAIDSYKDHPTVRKAALAAALQVANEAARTSKDEAAAPLGFRFIKEERAQ